MTFWRSLTSLPATLADQPKVDFEGEFIVQAAHSLHVRGGGGPQENNALGGASRTYDGDGDADGGGDGPSAGDGSSLLPF